MPYFPQYRAVAGRASFAIAMGSSCQRRREDVRVEFVHGVIQREGERFGSATKDVVRGVDFVDLVGLRRRELAPDGTARQLFRKRLRGPHRGDEKHIRIDGQDSLQRVWD